MMTSTDKEPLVSIIMPVYNAEKYLAEAIRSILNQTYRFFEFIIIDDGSTDDSLKILNQFAEHDSRFQIIKLESNKGVVHVLNLGLDRAKGKYIARMDADDVSLPNRMAMQVKYLEANPEVGILGARINYMDHMGKLMYVPPSNQTDLENRWTLFFGNPFSHPVVMIRKSVIDQHNLRYSSRATHVEDYELWGRLLQISRGANLPEILLYYRIHDGSVGNKHGQAQNRLAAKISVNIILNHLPTVSASLNELEVCTRIIWGIERLERWNRSVYIKVILKIWQAFSCNHSHVSGFSELKKMIVLRVARLILIPVMNKNWIESVCMISIIEWRWPIMLMGSMLKSFVKMRRANFNNHSKEIFDEIF